MAIKYKTTALVLPRQDGKSWAVEVEVVGDLGVHRTEKNPKEFTITHIPTKLSLTSVIPIGMTENKKKLLAWAAEVQEGMKKDWLAMRKYSHEEAIKGSETLKIRERLKTHCLTVK